MTPLPPSLGPLATDRFPAISEVTWLPARAVLGGEASDFTPWLAQPSVLEMLGTALKLEGLTAVRQEHPVLGKRLDILATAEDERGEEVAVCIENQYGMSDADHLGRLIAYLAQHETGRAVWVVEVAHDAYVAAVRFLNRTSTEDVGYYLVQVRFTHGSGNTYQVHFEVLAAPIAWERPTARTRRPINLARVDWVRALFDTIHPGLLGAGFPSLNMHVRGNYIGVRWPKDVWIREQGRRLSVRATRGSLIVAVNLMSYASREANAVAVSILQSEIGEIVAQRMPSGSRINWGAPKAQQGQREQVLIVRDDLGYTDGDVDEAGEWITEVLGTWLAIVREFQITDLDSRVATIHGPSAKVDDTDDGEEG